MLTISFLTPSTARLRRPVSCADSAASRLDFVDWSAPTGSLRVSTSSTGRLRRPVRCADWPASMTSRLRRLVSSADQSASLSHCTGFAGAPRLRRWRLRRRRWRAEWFAKRIVPLARFFEIESFFESKFFYSCKEPFVWHATSCIFFLNRLRTAQMRAESIPLSLSQQIALSAKFVSQRRCFFMSVQNTKSHVFMHFDNTKTLFWD